MKQGYSICFFVARLLRVKYNPNNDNKLTWVVIIPSFIFGVIMSILYIETKSLIVPIIIHSGSNFLAWLMSLAEIFFSNQEGLYNVTDFQSDWWIGLIGLTIGLPWLIKFMIKYPFSRTWTAPYFDSNQPSQTISVTQSG